MDERAVKSLNGAVWWPILIVRRQLSRAPESSYGMSRQLELLEFLHVAHLNVGAQVTQIPNF